MTQVPSHADQIVFLTRVQKILDEGQFVATYKFALLIALIDVAIERGDDSGAPLDVELAWLAEKFIELYWNHCKPYGGAVRSQNKGSNIAVLERIQALQTKTISLAEARRAPPMGRESPRHRPDHSGDAALPAANADSGFMCQPTERHAPRVRWPARIFELPGRGPPGGIRLSSAVYPDSSGLG